MIKRIWLYPPLALARVGSSPVPCENFYWGPDDLTPEGTARTRIVGTETLEVAKDGTVSVSPPSPTGSVIFKDEKGFRPVCPFFEVHAAWDDDGKEREGPITQALLDRFGLKASDLTWQVRSSISRPFISPDRLVIASQRRSGTGRQSYRQSLKGCSPVDSEPLVPAGQHILLGSVQATIPTAEFPEFRLRFTPPSGKVYAPSNISHRLQALKQADPPLEDVEKAREELANGADPMVVLQNFLLSINEVWQKFELPPDQCLLNPDAMWPKYNLIGVGDLLAQMANFMPRLADLQALSGRGDRSELIRAFLGPHKDVRNLPPPVFAFASEPPNILASLGMVDDMGDGTISVELRGLKASSGSLSRRPASHRTAAFQYRSPMAWPTASTEIGCEARNGSRTTGPAPMPRWPTCSIGHMKPRGCKMSTRSRISSGKRTAIGPCGRIIRSLHSKRPTCCGTGAK